MNNRWISALVAVSMLAGQTAPAFAGGRHDDRHWSGHDDDRRGWDDDDDDDRRGRGRHWDGRHWKDNGWRDSRHWDRSVHNRYHYAPPHAVWRGHPVRYVHYPRQQVVYYYDRPDVVYVRGAPKRYWYDSRSRGYYYKDDRGNAVLLGVALGAVGLAAVLAASR